ncbi:MAG: VWA domain-containing protein [Vicinamibacterales bacterium]
MTRAALALAGVLLCLTAPAAQDQRAYHGGTDLVAVYATVMDGSGHLVPDLQKSDFVVTDNGKKQTISVFSNDIQPITIVVMLDRSGSMAENFGMVRDAVGEFITRLLPADRARLGSLSYDIVISPADFTSDQQALRDVLEHGMQRVGPSPIWTAVDRSITALLPEGGRRVVLLFTDGHDSPERGQVHTSVKDIMWRTKVDEIMVYAIGFPSETTGFGGGIYVPVPRGMPQRPVLMSHHVEPPDPALKDLAAVSGGGYFEMDNEHDLKQTFARVADELHHQYLLGFAPAKLDDREHKIEVKASRLDLTVRARKSYVARPAGR